MRSWRMVVDGWLPPWGWLLGGDSIGTIAGRRAGPYIHIWLYDIWHRGLYGMPTRHIHPGGKLNLPASCQQWETAYLYTLRRSWISIPFLKMSPRATPKLANFGTHRSTKLRPCSHRHWSFEASVSWSSDLYLYALLEFDSQNSASLMADLRLDMAKVSLRTAVLHLARALGIPSVSSTYMMSLSGQHIRSKFQLQWPRPI